jgi:hypothetical protein
MQILLQIQTVLIPDLDPADMQSVHEGLYGLGVASRSRCEGEDAKMGVVRHHKADNLGVGIFACAFMSLI